MHHEKYDQNNLMAHTIELCKSCHMILHHQIRKQQTVEHKNYNR